MDVINKRYLILKNIDINNVVSSYVARDVTNNNVVQLNLLNSDYTPEKFIRFLIENFIDYNNIDSSNIIKTIDFGLVQNINERKIGYKQYYYTTEYIKGIENIKDVLKGCSSDCIIDLFVDICSGVHYLHLRSILYESINLNNIYILNNGNKYETKLCDLISVQIDKEFFSGDNRENLIFMAPEVINGAMPSKTSDIYSLGVLLYILLMLRIGIEIDFFYDIHKHMKNTDIKLDLNIINIINKMICEEENRYRDVREIIKDLNKALGKNYSVNKKADIEKLNFNNKLVDREYELNKVLSVYNQIKINRTQSNMILIHGERGIGKTKLLKEIERFIYLDGGRVYSIYNLKSNNLSSKGLYEIIKKLLESCSQEILKNYECELVKILPYIGNDKQVVTLQSLMEKKEKIRLLKVSENFLREVCENDEIVFIVDDIHLLDKFSIELIEYLYNNNKNIMFILSYCDDDALFDKELSEFILKERDNPNSISITLKELSEEGTIRFIKDILHLDKNPVSFSKKIYEHTYGNPLFIKETLKNFLLNKVIYIDENTGIWCSDYDKNYENLPIPRSLEQACMNQISKLNKKSYLIIEFISFFNNGVSKDIIKDFLNGWDLQCDFIIKDLCTKGIICEKIEDRGFVYDIYSKILKDIVYKKVNDDKKSKIHSWIADIFERENEEDKCYEDEIIYHLEKSGQNHKAIRYCVDSSEKMLKLRNREGALLSLKKALSLLNSEEYILKIELLIKVSKLYEDNANYKLAIDYGKNAESICIKIGEKRLLVDVYNVLGSAYLKFGKPDKAIKYIRASENLLMNMDYEKAYIKNRFILARIYLKNDENEKAISICNSAIELCGENHIKYKAILFSILGEAYMELNRAKDAIKSYKESYKCSESINYRKGIVVALNNLGIIYGDYYQKEDKMEECLVKAKEICETDKFVYYEIISLINLGRVYLYKYDYEKSLKYFLEGLDKSREINFEKMFFYSLNQLSMAYLRTNNYEMAYRYYTLSQQEFKNCRKQVIDEANFYRLQGEFLFNIGYMEKAKEYIKKAVNILSMRKFALKWRSEIQLQYINIIEEKIPENINKHINKIEKLLSNFKKYNEFDIVYHTAIILYKKGKKDLATNICNKYLYNFNENSNPKIKLRYMHLKSILSQDNNKIELMNSALKLSDKLNEQKIKYELCMEIGDWYLDRNQYIKGAHYYFEACKIIRGLLSGLPQNIKEQYIKINNLREPFYKLIYIRNRYVKPNINYNEINSVEKLLDFKYSMDLLKEKTFIDEAKEIYSKSHSIVVKNEMDIINNLTSDSMANLEMILKYLARITLASKGKILLEGQNEKYVTLVSFCEECDDGEDEEILKKVKSTKTPILLKYRYTLERDTAVICIPIIANNIKNIPIERRKKNRKEYDLVKGYVYLSSDKILNNFSEDSLKQCTNLTNLIDYILDKYQLKINSCLDPLTGTLTRKCLEDKIEEFIEEAYENKNTFSLIIFDLDNFKSINDSYGHRIGDEVLKKVSSVVLENIRNRDICGRYGGEEFIILLYDVDKYEAKRISDRLRRKIKKKVILEDNMPVTISMGVSVYPEHGYLKYELIEKADHALYVSKELGKDRCEIWKREFSSHIKHRNKLSGILSGNLVQDSKNISSIIDLINIINQEIDLEKKIYDSLGEIMNILSAECASIIYMDEDKVKKSFKRKINKEGWCKEQGCNNIIDEVVSKKQSICTMYWGEELGYGSINESSEWYSAMAVPLIRNGIIQSIVYVSVPLKLKRFDYDDLNLFDTLCKIIRLMQ
ncbi:diguanylate cyclase [Clostridium colicanis]|uniref:Diguanylate cyclase DosC n=1 Tax=Clostridium colicanis DSM 13634 TaxID=1121305 RepID=A0A151AMV0_9CLOT|nr:diguanylate cyclase [Clostridium colicanis]KYH28951.1 diguanylate cyclase DosC [Clostridium colicanis DSM 13634]